MGLLFRVDQRTGSRPLVIVSEVLFLLELEVVEHLLKQPARRAVQTAAERDVRRPAARGNRLEIVHAGISLVAAHFLDREVFGGLFDQRGELRRVPGFLVENPNSRHYVRFDAASYVALHPNALALLDSVLVVKPPLEFAG